MTKLIINKSENKSPNYYMNLALNEAKKAKRIGEVPVGAVIVDPIKQEIIATAYNKVIINNNPTHHAEILAISKAAKIVNNYRLNNLDLYVTLEPCPMCAGAIIQARLGNVFFGATDSKGGAVVSKAMLFSKNLSYNHIPDFKRGILEQESSELLKKFFKSIREKQ